MSGGVVGVEVGDVLVAGMVLVEKVVLLTLVGGTPSVGIKTSVTLMHSRSGSVTDYGVSGMGAGRGGFSGMRGLVHSLPGG
jgi:hypothetical protein